jgi:hypothetical protein
MQVRIARPAVAGLVAMVAVVQSAVAAPPDLGLNLIAPNRVVRGANFPLNAHVFNVAAPGADALNYSLFYTLPGGTNTGVVNGTRAADAGAGSDLVTLFYDTAGSPLGPNHFSVTAGGQAGTLHTPQTVELDVQVLRHVLPFNWISGNLRPLEGAQEPAVDPLAFGATGGGESFSAPSNAVGGPSGSNRPAGPNLVNSVIADTAALDLDSVFATGSSEITTTLVPTPNIPADLAPTAGLPWQINVKNQPGHYEKMLTLTFSDEDIPGAVSPSSIVSELLIKVDVNANGATGTLTVLPEPAIAILLTPLALLRRRGRCCCRR